MKTLPQQFFATAQRWPEKCALRYKQGGVYRDLSFAQVAAAIRKVASALMGVGLRPGERFAILSENRPEWVMADLGGMLAGAITVPIHTTFSARLAAEVLKNSGSRFLFLSGSEQLKKILSVLPELGDLQKIISLEADSLPIPGDGRFLRWQDFLNSAREEAAFPDASPEDVCTLMYTSGTTGRPKGVMLTHRNFLSNAQASLQVIPFTDRDTLLSFLPLSHVLERMGGYYAPLVLAGATVAYARSLKELSENLLEIKPTAMISVPRLYAQVHDRIRQESSRKGGLMLRVFRWAMRSHPGTPAHFLADRLIFRQIRGRFGGRLRFAISGGAGLNPELAVFFRQIGVIICEGYGLTETSPVIAVNRPDQVKIGTVGRPLPGVEVEIAADGEILVRGPSVTQGYWQDAEATRELLDPEGWLHTGDLGAKDSDGLLKIIGRKKEILVTAGGKNVWPAALEAKLNASSYIAQSMVTGDGEKSLGALIVPEKTSLLAWGQEMNIPKESWEALLNHPQVLSLYRRELDAATVDVAEYEKIARFTLLPQEFTFEREELTPTLKIRRHQIAEHYRNEIQSLFRSRPSA